MLPTIYIPLASLEDNELVPTVKNIYEAAEFPDRVFVHVSVTDDSKQFYKDSVQALVGISKNLSFDFIEITKRNSLKVLGVGAGRKAAMSKYANQDYVLQIDSHSWLTHHWDTLLIDALEAAIVETGNKKTILTAYAGYYGVTETSRFADDLGFGLPQYPFFLNAPKFHGVIPRWETMPLKKISDRTDKFLPAIKFNANFSFGNREFGNYTGLHETALFFEEEPLQTLNLVSRGFDLVFPNFTSPVICHMYSGYAYQGNATRKFLDSYAIKDNEIRDRRSQENYVHYVEAHKNEAWFKKYERYARVNLKLGATKSVAHFPPTYFSKFEND